MYIHTRYDDVGIVMRNWAFMVLYSVSGSNMGWDWCLLSIILEPWVNKFAHIDSPLKTNAYYKVVKGRHIHIVHTPRKATTWVVLHIT